MSYMIWVTGACNLRCKYCYEGSDKLQLHMSQDIADKTIGFIEKDFDIAQKELLVNFHGGEPFLRVRLMEYFINVLKAKYESCCNVVFSATTNATLLNEDVRKFIIKNNIAITVSLDGKAKTHDSTRIDANGKGSHTKALRNSLMLLKEYPLIRVRMTFNTETVEDLSKNVEFLLEQGFRSIVPGIDSFDKRWDEQHIKTLKKEILKIKEIHKKYPNALISLCEPLTRYGNECTGGTKSKHIYYDGKIYPCTITCGHKDFLIGDVDSGVSIKQVGDLQKKSKANNPICSECDLLQFCSGARCKYISKVITGSFLQPAPIDCNWTRLIYEINGCDF